MSTDTSLPDVRTRLIEAAIRLLATNGPSEVKARSVASEAGLSTMGVYTHLGGVTELLRAVADEGFKRLANVFVRAPSTENPITDLCTMLLACRDFARSNPHLYDLMFGLSIDGRYSPSRCPITPLVNGNSTAYKTTISVLVKACTRLTEAKHVRKIDPTSVAFQLWSAAHGFILLELAGHFAEVANPPAEILVPMCNNIVVGMGAQRARVESATTDAIAGWAEREKK